MSHDEYYRYKKNWSGSSKGENEDWKPEGSVLRSKQIGGYLSISVWKSVVLVVLA